MGLKGKGRHRAHRYKSNHDDERNPAVTPGGYPLDATDLLDPVLAEDEMDATAQAWESEWWGSCTNSFGEEAKQITYAHRMGLVNTPRYGKWPVYDLNGYSVVDLGGGPSSLLLKCVNGWGTVVDPCPYPEWVAQRYASAGSRNHPEYEAATIFYVQEPAETYRSADKVSECWIYNVLQHVVDPERVIATARASAHLIRIFEWIEAETNVGHPHSLHAADLSRWITGSEGAGTIQAVDENGAVGLAFYGTFPL